jgi:hypothetical protein
VAKGVQSGRPILLLRRSPMPGIPPFRHLAFPVYKRVAAVSAEKPPLPYTLLNRLYLEKPR